MQLTADSERGTRLSYTKHNPWSPDNSKILFTRIWSSGGLYAINSDGTGRKLLDSAGLAGEWSPDGKEIVYNARSVSGSWDVYKIKFDGSDRTQLISIEDSDDHVIDTFRPAWSPSGDKIAVRIKVNDVWQLWSMNSDGTDQMPLVESGTKTFVWSPEGGRLAVQLDDGMVIINTDGSVSFTQPEVTYIDSWAPSGEHIAVRTDDGIGVLNLNDGRVKYIKDYFDETYVSFFSGSFSSDGEWIVFTSNEDPVFLRIWALHIESEELIQMVEGNSPRCSNASLK